MTPVVDRIVLCSGADEARYWLDDVPVIQDLVKGYGGLSGVHAALSLGSDVLAVAWDMPFVPGSLLRHLRSVGESAKAGVVVPESNAPHGIEPFCAWYGARAAPGIDAFLRGGGGAAHALIASLPDVVRVPLADSGRFGDPATMFMSVNTPDDLARARRIAKGPR